MRLRIIVDQSDTHVHFRVFVYGALAGKLVFRKAEYLELKQILKSVNKTLLSYVFEDDLVYRKDPEETEEEGKK